MVPAACYGLALFNFGRSRLSICPGLKHQVDLHAVPCPVHDAAETFPVS